MLALRHDGRSENQIRSPKIFYNSFGYSSASILFEMGNTKILASVTLQEGVPRFMKGRGTGWLTAEYSLLPTSTRSRTTRQSSQSKPNSRSLEISRLIGRSLRTVTDLSLLGERTIIVDCDVLQADGGTRCASICAANIALQLAGTRWVKDEIIKRHMLREQIGAISVGIVDGRVYLDLTQFEDNRAEVDFNFVLTKSGNIIEIQGTSEKTPMSWENFGQLKTMALQGVNQIFGVRSSSLFSLENRVQNQDATK